MTWWTIAFLVCYIVTMATCSQPPNLGSNKNSVPLKKRVFPMQFHYTSGTDDTSGDGGDKLDRYNQRPCVVETQETIKHEGRCTKLGGYWPVCIAGEIIGPFSMECGPLPPRKQGRAVA